MNRPLLITILAITTVLSAGAAAFVFFREPPHVTEWRAKAIRLDDYCESVRTRFESERIDLAKAGERERVLERIKEEMRTWWPKRIDICVGEPVDWNKRDDCAHVGDVDCLIAMDRSIEAAIGKR